ncbi:molybdopterin-dependent oxidoreductase, partial [Roseateles sp. GG27B]
ISGTLAKGNRGPLDPALDQMMAKQGIQFSKAWVFDAAALYRLPAVTIQPTLEYDAKVHRLSGPLITTVLKAAGVDVDSAL